VTFIILCLILLTAFFLALWWLLTIRARVRKLKAMHVEATSDTTNARQNDRNRIGAIEKALKTAKEIRIWARLGTVGSLAVFIIYVTLNGLVTVETGTIKQPKLFGGVIENTFYEEGLNWVPPIYDLVTINIKNQTLELSGTDTLGGFSGDPGGGVYIETFDMNISFRVNKNYAWALIREIGVRYKGLIKNATRSAARTVLGRTPWADAATKKQDEFVANIKAQLERVVSQRLIQQGVDAEIASNIFLFSTPEVRKFLPPEAIRDAGAEEQAAGIEKDRQAKLTDAEAEVAKRQVQVGLGINNLFTNIGLNPKNMSAGDIANILGVLADMKRAETFERMIRKENSPVSWGVIVAGGGGNTPAISLPTPGAVPERDRTE